MEVLFIQTGRGQGTSSLGPSLSSVEDTAGSESVSFWIPQEKRRRQNNTDGYLRLIVCRTWTDEV